METTFIHNDITFVITVVSFPDGYTATIRTADATLGFRKTMRSRPNARLSREIAELFITRTF